MHTLSDSFFISAWPSGCLRSAVMHKRLRPLRGAAVVGSGPSTYQSSTLLRLCSLRPPPQAGSVIVQHSQRPQIVAFGGLDLL